MVLCGLKIDLIAQKSLNFILTIVSLGKMCYNLELESKGFLEIGFKNK